MVAGTREPLVVVGVLADDDEGGVDAHPRLEVEDRRGRPALAGHHVSEPSRRATGGACNEEKRLALSLRQPRNRRDVEVTHDAVGAHEAGGHRPIAFW